MLPSIVLPSLNPLLTSKTSKLENTPISASSSIYNLFPVHYQDQWIGSWMNVPIFPNIVSFYQGSYRLCPYFMICNKNASDSQLLQPVWNCSAALKSKLNVLNGTTHMSSRSRRRNENIIFSNVTFPITNVWLHRHTEMASRQSISIE